MSDGPAPGVADRVPVTILTGFLGSGKTTLLNALLRHPATGPTAVVVNEFGSAAIDATLVQAAAEEVRLLDPGCLCCQVRGDLVEALATLAAGVGKVDGRPFRRVIVETTGLADPLPVVHTLLGAAGPLGPWYLDGVVTVVDGLEGGRELTDHPLCRRQVALADRLVLTKGDLAGDVALAGLEANLRSLNPSAPVLRTSHGALDPANVLDIGLYDAARKRIDVDRWLPDRAGQVQRAPRTCVHLPGVETFCIERERPLGRATLGMWLSAVLEQLGGRILRVKGLVHLTDGPCPLVIQAVQHRLYPPAPLTGWPGGQPRTRVVFIGQDVHAAQVEHLLEVAEAAAEGVGRLASAGPSPVRRRSEVV